MEILITNTGKMAEGTILSTWVTLPCYEDDFEEALKSIEVDGNRYVDWTLSDTSTGLDCTGIGEHPTLADLNEWAYCEENYHDIACAISEADGIHSVDRHECNNRTLFRNVEDAKELGECIVDQGYFPYEIPDGLENYLDYESIGFDWESEGSYTTYGFLMGW